MRSQLNIKEHSITFADSLPINYRHGQTRLHSLKEIECTSLRDLYKYLVSSFKVYTHQFLGILLLFGNFETFQLPKQFLRLSTVGNIQRLAHSAKYRCSYYLNNMRNLLTFCPRLGRVKNYQFTKNFFTILNANIDDKIDRWKEQVPGRIQF